MTTRSNPRIIPPGPLFVFAALILVLGGCGADESTAPELANTTGDDFSAVDFDAPFGSLTMSDEPLAFGDPDLLADDCAGEGEMFDDPYANDPAVLALIELGEEPGDPDDPQRPRFTFLRILWGVLDGEGTSQETDWSGRLWVDRGTVLVRRVISFEHPEDHIVRPRPDRHTVAWHSHAGRDFDGLLIQIIEPPLGEPGGGQGHGHGTQGRGDDHDPPPPPNRLHFATGPFTEVFLVSELAELDAIYPVEAAGQAIHFTGFTLGNFNQCPRGFLAGRWLFNTDSELGGGHFWGRWISIHGPVLGYLRGAWGFNAEGERVFFGKYINRQGTCLGLLAGTWAPGLRPNTGRFHGRWFGHDEQFVGVMDGHYRKHPLYRMGPFQGRWAALCHDEARGLIGQP